MADSSFWHGHWDYVGSFHHLRIPHNIHLYAANLRNGNSAKYFTHYALRNSAKYKYPLWPKVTTWSLVNNNYTST